jgi:hypothetical protein
MKLLKLEEEVIVKHILDLMREDFPPGLLLWLIWPILCALSVICAKLA